MGLIELQSTDHRDLLDTIDKIRSIGVSNYVDLPEIVVCGDQSAGKSSVLEAISGMSFPMKDNLCTRFPTELVLRRDLHSKVQVSIIGGGDRSSEDCERLSNFQFDVDADGPNLSKAVEQAKQAMGLSESKAFSDDILRVEVCGPSQPHLTLIDLPGLFRAGNRDQSVDDAKTVRNMVWNYMDRPRCIILAVVSAKSDYALQDVTELAREVDPKGVRTMGLITKPDTLDPGSESEASYVNLAQNNDVKFRLGWHVLKNRSYETRHVSSAERDKDENEFFKTGKWGSVDPDHLGIKKLTLRLSKNLKDLILHQLPSLIHDVNEGIISCKERLNRLGESRVTIHEQRRYLARISKDFTMIMKSAADGVYRDPFFGNAANEEGYRKRLRAVIQNALVDYAEDMRVNGRSRTIIEDLADDEELQDGKVSRSDYVSEVRALVRKSRGCELPGTFNPLIIGELFAQQSRPWRSITEKLTGLIIESVRTLTRSVLDHVATQDTAERLFEIIGHSIDTLSHNLDEKLTMILQPHLSGHPITYNHYLTDNVQKAQSQRRNTQLEKIFREFFGDGEINGTRSMNPYRLLCSLQVDTEVDMEQHAAETAVDFAEAYYTVAIKKFIDDISVLAFEQELVSKLPDLFLSETIYDTDEKKVSWLAGETPEAAEDRVRYAEKLDVLEEAHVELKRLSSHSRSVHFDRRESDSTAPSKIADLNEANAGGFHFEEHVAQTDPIVAPEEFDQCDPVGNEFLSEWGVRPKAVKHRKKK